MDLNRKKTFRNRFENYYPLLCKVAYRYIPRKEECEDVVQETFISIWKKGKDSLSEKEFVSYIITSVKNNCISYLRKQKLETIYMEEMILSPADVSEDESNDQDSASPEEILMEALSVLPPKCKEVFLMSKLHNMKYREISEALNISEKTVENHIGKAIKTLRAFVKTNSFLLVLIVLFSILIIC